MRSFFIVQIVLAFGLVGCGGDSGSTSGQSDNETSDSDLVKSTFDDLPVCTAKREGATAYIKNEKIAYVCENGKWVEDSDVVRSDDSREESCDSRSGGSSSSVILSSVSHEEFSSSSSVEQNSSATLLDGGWNWNVPKESRLNQEITYGTMTDSRDNKVYKIVKIGDQTWMAENLNYKVSGSYCYKNADSNCTRYGRLYTWASAMDSAGLFNLKAKGCGKGNLCVPEFPIRGVCPDGWHLPSYGDWETLFRAAGASFADYEPSFEGLQSDTGWNVNRGGGSRLDYGFSILPGGARMEKEQFYYASTRAYFWIAREGDADFASVIVWKNSRGDIYDDDKSYGFSVRCVKDIAEEKGIVPEISYGTLQDYRDGQTYKTVVIDSQIWMAENLNYEVADSYCYNNDDSNCYGYGRLYTWSSAAANFENDCASNDTCVFSKRVKGVCPYGWHLPSRTEWNTLFTVAGGDSLAGTNLKSTRGWSYETYPNQKGACGLDVYGFTAFPEGMFFDEKFQERGYGGYFWSSTEEDDRAYGFYLLSSPISSSNAGVKSYDKISGFSVRCLKDGNASFLWDGSEKKGSKVYTGFSDGAESSGYWYDYSDSEEGGASAFVYPFEGEEKVIFDDKFDQIVSTYGGIKGAVSLGYGVEFPYAGLAFDIVGKKRQGADISAWGGICLTYESSIIFSIEIVDQSDAFATDYTNNFRAVVAKSNGNTVDIPWDKFKQDNNKINPKNLEKVLFNAAVVRVNFEGKSGTSGKFFIQSIGSLGQCQ